MSGRHGQLTTVLQRLGDGLALLNPVKLVSVAREALRELGTPPPGDPAALRALAGACRAAATDLQPLALRVRRLPDPPSRTVGVGPPAAAEGWRSAGSRWPEAAGRPLPGLTGASFAEVRNATANAVGRAPDAFTAVAAALDTLAGRVEEQQRAHAELRRRLREALHDGTHLGSVAAPDPAALDDLTTATASLIRGGVRLYTEAIEAVDRAAAAFADVAGLARAGAAWDGGSAAGGSPDGAGLAAATRPGQAPVTVETTPGDRSVVSGQAAAEVAAGGRSAVAAGEAAAEVAAGGRPAVAAGEAGAEVAAGGLSAADAVVLAEHGVRVGGYDGGTLTVAQLRRAGERLAALADPDATTVRRSIEDARSGTERAYLLKALAAGHEPAELAAFAQAIRGRDDAWLHNHLTLIDRDGPGAQDRFGAEVDQYDEYTCGTTSAIVTLAEADPVYALSLTSGLEPPYDQADREEFDRRLTAEQRRVHDATNVVWPRRLGTLPAGIAAWLNGHATATGTRYRWHLVDDTDRREVSAALREVAAAADGGHPAPVLVGGPVPRHYVLVVGHAGDDLLIFEPTSGDTRRVPVADFTGGTLAEETGFDHVQAVIVPQRRH